MATRVNRLSTAAVSNVTVLLVLAGTRAALDRERRPGRFACQRPGDTSTLGRAEV